MHPTKRISSFRLNKIREPKKKVWIVEDKEVALIHAVKESNVEKVKLLLKSKVELFRVIDDKCPYSIALETGKEEVISLFRAYDQNPELFKIKKD